jgi:HEAT repeat protein
LLKPGEKLVERLLLNFDHEIDAPGDYRIEAIRRLPKMVGSTGLQNRKHHFEFRETLYFRLDEEISAPAQSFQPWIEQLKSDDFMTRIEAAKALASLAPRSFEDVIIAFAADPQFRGFAPLALHRLNTSRSMAAMAELLRTSQPGSSESMDSDKYLAEAGDQQWFPLLRDIAMKNAENLPYVTNAAKLGESNMVPSLLSLLSSPDKQFTVTNAVSSLGYTASRSVIPVLIDLLKEDRDIADRAAGSLQVLTHPQSRRAAAGAIPKMVGLVDA